MRSREDIEQELLQLRDACRTLSDQEAKARKEIKVLTVELDWWRKTFGPEQVAPR